MMSDFSLLVVASVGAAVAFFVAGMLLRRPRTPGASKDDEKVVESSATADLRTECARLAAELAEAKRQSLGEAEARKAEQAARATAERQSLAEAEARKAEQAARATAEREREAAEAERVRLAAREKTLAERLRAAEDGGRAALEQVESNAAAWDARWQASTAEYQRQEQALAQQIAELRERLARESKDKEGFALRESGLRDDLDRSNRTWQQKLGEAETALQATRAATDRAPQAKHAEAEAAWQARQAEAEAAWRAELTAKESAWQARLASSEAAWQTKVENAERARQGSESALQAECRRLGEQLDKATKAEAREREQSQHLSLALQTAEQALLSERAQAKAASEALRIAENRLRDLERLEQENAELRAEQARMADETAGGVAHEAAVKDAKVELAAAQAKLAELAEVLEENRKLRDEVAELREHQADRNELERLTAVHKQLRLDAELMARRLDELTRDHDELVPLRSQAAEAASLKEEVEYLRRREKDLEAQLYANGVYASREIPAQSCELSVHTPVSNMESSLDELLGQGGPRTAVLADSQGFLIAGAGESVAQEGLAAFAAVAGEMVSRARMLLPLAEIDSIRVTDANRMVLTCHLFASDGQGLGVATLGPGEPPAEKTQQTIAGLAATLSSEGGNEDGSSA
jgi:hypothetical protein